MSNIQEDITFLELSFLYNIDASNKGDRTEQQPTNTFCVRAPVSFMSPLDYRP